MADAMSWLGPRVGTSFHQDATTKPLKPIRTVHPNLLGPQSPVVVFAYRILRAHSLHNAYCTQVQRASTAKVNLHMGWPDLEREELSATLVAQGDAWSAITEVSSNWVVEHTAMHATAHNLQRSSRIADNCDHILSNRLLATGCLEPRMAILPHSVLCQSNLANWLQNQFFEKDVQYWCTKWEIVMVRRERSVE